MTAATVTTRPASQTTHDAGLRSRVETAFDAHATSLLRFFAVRCGGDVHEADDLMQQLWLQTMRSAGDVPRGELEYWLRAVAKNLIRTHWRKRGVRKALPDAALAAELGARLSAGPLTPEALEREELRTQLLMAVTELRSDEQALIIDHYFHQRSFAELAKQLNIGERAIEGRLYRARQTLRAKLAHLTW